MENNKSFEIEPYQAAKPVEFGMSPDEVTGKLEENPSSEEKYPDTQKLKNRYYFDGAVRVHFDQNETVDEISFVPRSGVSLSFNGENLFDEKTVGNPLTVFLKQDKNPLDDYGFIVFEKLGVAVTGYHDRDKSQRAITVFKKGRWTDLDQAKPIDLSKFSK